jgi:hypothetical protein
MVDYRDALRRKLFALRRCLRCAARSSEHPTKLAKAARNVKHHDIRQQGRLAHQ